MTTRILVAFATSEGQTARVADYLADRLTARGHAVTKADLARTAPDLAEFDAVVLGGSVHAGSFQRELQAFITGQRDTLKGLPGWFFGVSLCEGVQKGLFTHEAALAQIQRLLDTSGWTPRESLSVGGAIKYREYSWPKRMLMRQILRKNGAETDTSRDWEYTDWESVGNFAERISAAVAAGRPAEVSRS